MVYYERKEGGRAGKRKRKDGSGRRKRPDRLLYRLSPDVAADVTNIRRITCRRK